MLTLARERPCRDCEEEIWPDAEAAALPRAKVSPYVYDFMTRFRASLLSSAFPSRGKEEDFPGRGVCFTRRRDKLSRRVVTRKEKTAKRKFAHLPDLYKSLRCDKNSTLVPKLHSREIKLPRSAEKSTRFLRAS